MGRVGVALHEVGAVAQLAAIEQADRLGVSTVWMTSGGTQDAMTIFAAAAARTERVGLGTAIVPTYPRHPLALVAQAVTIASLAPGRFRLGVGPSHKATIENTFGIPFDDPLGHLREYVNILRAALHDGSVDLDGERLRAHMRVSDPPKLPILISALRPASWRLAGEISDGGLAWICPLPFLRDRARPALDEGARKAERATPPLVAHCFVVVHDDLAAAREEGRRRLAFYARTPFYQQMFVEAGFPEATEGVFSDPMLDAVLVAGDERRVERGLRAYLDAGMDEVIASIAVVGDDRRASLERTMGLIASL